MTKHARRPRAQRRGGAFVAPAVGGILALAGCSLATNFSGLSNGVVDDGDALANGDAVAAEGGADALPSPDADADATAAPLLGCKQLAGKAASGRYRIDPDGPGPIAAFDAYCENDLAEDDGGWTLLLKADGTLATFVNGSVLWTTAAVLNTSSTDLLRIESKVAGYATLPFTAVRLGMADASGVHWLVLPQAAGSLLEVFSGPRIPTAAGRAKWLGLVATPSLQDNCNDEGFNVPGSFGRALRLGIFGNNEANCDTSDSWIGLGGVDPESTTPACGNFNSPTYTPSFCFVMVR